MVRRVLISIHQKALDVIDEIAKRDGKTRSEIIRHMTRYYSKKIYPDLLGDIPDEE